MAMSSWLQGMHDVLRCGGASSRPRMGTPRGGAGEVAARPACGMGTGRARVRSRTRPCLEYLEGRLVLSNVSATLAGGSLTITFPATASISISQSGPGLIDITNTTNPVSTVNGQTGPVLFAVSKDLTIDLNAGNDTVTFAGPTPISINGNLSVNGGPGNDTVSSLPGPLTPALSVGGNLNITGQNGTDTESLSGLSVKGNMQVQTGDGDGDNVSVFSSTIGGNAQIQTGDGALDSIGVSSIAIRCN